MELVLEPGAKLKSRVEQIRARFRVAPTDVKAEVFQLAPHEQVSRGENVMDFSDWQQWSQWSQAQ